MDDDPLDTFEDEQPHAIADGWPHRTSSDDETPVNIVLTEEQLAAACDMLPTEGAPAEDGPEVRLAASPSILEYADDYQSLAALVPQPAVVMAAEPAVERGSPSVTGPRIAMVSATLFVTMVIVVLGGRTLVQEFAATAPAADVSAVRPSSSTPAPSAATVSTPTPVRAAASTPTPAAVPPSTPTPTVSVPGTPAPTVAQGGTPAMPIARTPSRAAGRTPTPPQLARRTPTPAPATLRTPTPPQLARRTPSQPTAGGRTPTPTAPLTRTPTPTQAPTTLAASTPTPPVADTSTPAPPTPAIASASNPTPVTPASPPAASPVVAPPTAPPAPALAPETRAVLLTLYRYQEAFSALDSSAAHAVWPGVDVKALDRAFDQLEQQTFNLQGCNVTVSGTRADASCSGSASYARKVGNRAVHEEPRQWHFTLQQRAGEWLIDRVDAR